jgi:hypothetical protein
VRRHLVYAPMNSPLMTDFDDFVARHREHGDLFADASTPRPNGYRLGVRCHCGVTFERRVTPEDAGVELSLFARWN